MNGKIDISENSQVWSELLDYIFEKISELGLKETEDTIKAIVNTYVVEEITEGDYKNKTEAKELGTTSLRERTPKEKLELALSFFRSRLLEAPIVTKNVVNNLKRDSENVRFISDINSTEPDLSKDEFTLKELEVAEEDIQYLTAEFDELYKNLSLARES